MLRPSVCVVVTLTMLAGCLAPLGADKVPCEPPSVAVLTGPVDQQRGITRQTDRSIPALVRITNHADIELRPIVPDFPTRAHAPNRMDDFAVTTFTANESLLPGATYFGLVEYNGGFGGEYPPFEIRATMYAVDAPQCVNTPSVSSVYTFIGDYEGETAQPGVGALVRTAGFWTNGTLFYTNMDDVHNNTAFARAGWYQFEGNAPLPVYVYNSTRTERPQRYNESGFVTTIPGFNEALKGLSIAGSRVAHLAPEEAYTREGNEDHDLYGDELVFYIEVKDVVAVDCELPEPVCDPPTVPPASHEATHAARGDAPLGAPTAT